MPVLLLRSSPSPRRQLLIPSNHSSPQSRKWPAWAVSVVTHTLIVTTALVVIERRPRGAADEPTREAGIVLRRQEESQIRYEGEEADRVAEPTPSESFEPNLEDALPAASESDLSNYLPSKTAPLHLEATGLRPATSGAAGGGKPHGALAIGGEATTSVFGVEGSGHKFVYAFDRSVSMTGAPLSAAKQQLLASLDSLGSTHQFQILFFNHRIKAFDLTQGHNRIAFANDQTRSAARRFVESIAADGGTDRYQALRRALQMNPDVVFFLTDADDAMTGEELSRIAQLNNRVGASICAIEFGRGPDRGKHNFLRALADSSGGRYGYVDTTRLMRE